MNAIYAYKEFSNHYKPLNDDFYELSKLSIISAKKYYKTVLYCDSVTNKKFIENGLLFDEVIILDKIENYGGNLYCIPKIMAMMEQKEPYIMLDFDSIILEPITSNHTITYGHYEVNLMNNSNDDVINWYHESYIKPFREHLKNYFNNDELNFFDWIKTPNFSLLIVNNPYIVNHIYRTIIDRIPLNVMEKCTATLIEQFLCHQFLNILKVDYGVLINEMYLLDFDFNNKEFNTKHFLFKKYVHININDVKIKEIIKLLGDYLQQQPK